MARTIKTFNRKSGNIFRAKYPVTTHFSGLIIPVTNYSLFTGTPPAKMRITVRKLLFQRLLLYNYADSADFARTGGKSIECKESSTSFDGPSVFSISSLNLTIKERNEEGNEGRVREGEEEGRGGGWSGASWDEAHLPYGCGAAPYLGSAKRGAGLPFPVASFLCALDPVKKKREKNHLNYTIHRFVSERSQASWQPSKQNFWNRSIDIDQGSSCLPFFFFFLPLLPRFPFIEIVYGMSRPSPQEVLFYSGVCIGIGRGAICFAERNCAKFNLRIESVFLSIGGAQTVERIL